MKGKEQPIGKPIFVFSFLVESKREKKGKFAGLSIQCSLNQVIQTLTHYWENIVFKFPHLFLKGLDMMIFKSLV